MKRNNSTETSQKQAELKKRLQEIRQQRLEIEQAERAGVDMRQSETRIPKSNLNKNKRNRNQQQTRQRSNSQEQHSRSEPISLESTDDSYSSRKYRQARSESANKNKRIQETAQKMSKKKKNPLISQLSNSENLAQAFILSEVLSKPVALRKRRR